MQALSLNYSLCARCFIYIISFNPLHNRRDKWRQLQHNKGDVEVTAYKLNASRDAFCFFLCCWFVSLVTRKMSGPRGEFTKKTVLGACGECKCLREGRYPGGLERAFGKYLAFRRAFVNLVTKGASEHLGLRPDCKGLRMNTSCRSQQNAGHILPRSLMERTREGNNLRGVRAERFSSYRFSQ